MSMKEWDKYK